MNRSATNPSSTALPNALNHHFAAIARRDTARKANGTSMESSKPEPIYQTPSLGTICPVCGKKSYSAAGVHPQCSMQQADAPRQAALAAQKKLNKAAADAARLAAATKEKAKFNQSGGVSRGR